MPGMVMEIGDKELRKIGEYVRGHLEEWIRGIRGERELDLIERSIRLEMDVKNFREEMIVRFNAVNARFETIGKRFEATDIRFESLDKRFESLDKRFEMLQRYMDKRFSQMQWTMGLGFTMIVMLMGVFNFF